MGSVAKSYMRKGFLIYEKMRKYLTIYEEAIFDFATDSCGIYTRKILFYVTDGNIMYLTDACRFLISCVIQHYAPVVGW